MKATLYGVALSGVITLATIWAYQKFLKKDISALGKA
jgi:hypothetical protein